MVQIVEVWGAGSNPGQIPILTAEFTDFQAGQLVNSRFSDALTYAETVREKALQQAQALVDLGDFDFIDNLIGQDDNKLEFDDFSIEPGDLEPGTYDDEDVTIDAGENRVFSFDEGLFDGIPSLTANDIPDGDDINDPPQFEQVLSNQVEDIGDPSALPIGFDDPYLPDLKNKLLQEFMDSLGETDGSYAPEVEQAIYDRARNRRKADLQDKKDAAFNDFAKRGFPAPPGALFRLIERYDIEDHREETDLNADIMRLQADLIRQKYEFIVSSGLQLEASLLERARQVASNTLEKSRLQAQQALDIYNAELRGVEVHASVLQSDVALFAEKVRAETAKLEAFKTRLSGITSKLDLERLIVQIQQEKRQTKVDKYNFQLQKDRFDLEKAQAEESLQLDNKRVSNDVNRMIMENDRLRFDVKRAIADFKQTKYQQEIDIALQKQNHKREIAATTANILAQLAASALTGVSASASMSGSQSDSASKSYSTSMSRNDSVSTRVENTE